MMATANKPRRGWRITSVPPMRKNDQPLSRLAKTWYTGPLGLVELAEATWQP